MLAAVGISVLVAVGVGEALPVDVGMAVAVAVVVGMAVAVGVAAAVAVGVALPVTAVAVAVAIAVAVGVALPVAAVAVAVAIAVAVGVAVDAQTAVGVAVGHATTRPLTSTTYDSNVANCATLRSTAVIATKRRTVLRRTAFPRRSDRWGASHRCFTRLRSSPSFQGRRGGREAREASPPRNAGRLLFYFRLARCDIIDTAREPCTGVLRRGSQGC